MWPSNLTLAITHLDLEFSRSNMEFAISQRKVVWLLRNEKQTYRLNSRPQMWPMGLTSTMILTFEFLSNVILTIWWPRSGVRIYQIGTGVTSDVGVPSTHLVRFWSRSVDFTNFYDDVIKWKHFPRYWPFVRGIHRSPVNSLHKGQWRGALMFSLICVWINGWVNNRGAGD